MPDPIAGDLSAGARVELVLETDDGTRHELEQEFPWWTLLKQFPGVTSGDHVARFELEHDGRTIEHLVPFHVERRPDGDYALALGSSGRGDAGGTSDGYRTWL